jgi:epsilon-lactone hydrolase
MFASASSARGPKRLNHAGRRLQVAWRLLEQATASAGRAARTERRAIIASHQLETIRALLTSKPRPAGWSERRQRLDEVGSVWPVAKDITLAPADMGGVPGEWSSAPGCDPAHVLMFLHGGGYCSGSIRSHRRMATEAGRAGASRTLAVGYRLAPEHPFPAALDDALTAWQFLRGQGVPACNIAVGGDSAGGGLTVALLTRLKEAGEELPACAWLVSPWTDLTMSGASMISKDAVDPLLHRAYLEELAAAYVPAGMDRSDPRLSVLFADLRDLPPMLVQVGSAETLLDDALRLTAKAGECGVFVTLEVWPDMIHAWHLWNARLPEGRRALGNAGAFLQRHLAGSTGRAADAG